MRALLFSVSPAPIAARSWGIRQKDGWWFMTTIVLLSGLEVDGAFGEREERRSLAFSLAVHHPVGRCAVETTETPSASSA